MSNSVYENFTMLQRQRFQALVRAMVEGDCLPLVHWMGNKAPDIYQVLNETWPSDGKVVFYEDACAILMGNEILRSWVFDGLTPEFA